MRKLPTRPDNLKSVRDLASQVEKTSKTALDANNKMDDVSSVEPCEFQNPSKILSNLLTDCQYE